MVLELFLTIGCIVAFYNIYFLAKREGFLEEKVVDFLLICTFSFLIVGKLFFILLNPRIYGYYNVSSVIYSGFDPFFGMISAIFASYVYIRVLNKWSLNKVADILAKGVSFLMAAVFLGQFFNNNNPNYLFLGGLWILVFLLFNFVEKSHLVGTSSKTFRVKRITFWAIPRFHLYAFLISSFIIFLLFNILSRPPLWKIKSVLYITGFLITIVRMVKDLQNENLTDKVKEALLSQKKKIEKEEKELSKNDPYFVKGRDMENAEEGDEVMDDLGHREVDMEKGIYAKLKQKIDKTLALISVGKYGKCEKCGNKIEEARLKANPYAVSCVSCSMKGK